MKNVLVLFCLCLLAGTTALAAQRKPGAPAPAGNRFLFVVETTSAMLPFEHAGRQAAFDLIYSGIGSQMQPGDTIGVWTFGEEAHGGLFPMQIWQPEQNLQLASQVGLFLKGQRYESQGRPDRVIPKLLSLIKSVKDVNVLTVSGNELAWKGTAFEQDISLAYQKSAGESRNTKRPLITTLVARNGQIVSWSVTLAGDPISLPKPAALTAVQAETAQPPKGESKAAISNDVSASAAAIASKPAPPPAPNPTSSAVSVSAPAAASLSSDTPQSASAGNAATAATSPPTTTETKPDNPMSARVPIRSIVITSKGTVTNGEPDSKPTAVPAPASEKKTLPAPEAAVPVDPVHKPLPTLLLAPVTVAAREPPFAANVAASPTAPPLAMATPPQPLLAPRSLFLIGGAITVAALGVLLLVRRLFRRAPQSSFITRSFDRDH